MVFWSLAECDAGSVIAVLEASAAVTVHAHLYRGSYKVQGEGRRHDHAVCCLPFLLTTACTGCWV
jgi:hypothetical protein